jgi:WD40 repeat protein
VAIYKYEDTKETLLICASDGRTPIIKDVSSNGNFFLYILREGSGQEMNERFFYVSTNAPENAVELKTCSGDTDSKVINALFSPDGNTILHIESSGNGNYMYFVDITKPGFTPQLAYRTDQRSLIFGTPSIPLNLNMLQPTWMSNGYFAVNSETPILLKVNKK